MTLSINNTAISTANVVSNDTANSIAIDFSPIFLRIAVALENLANNSSNVVGVLSTVANATYLSANNTANLVNAAINHSNNFNSIANATYLSANNTANLVNAAINHSNNFNSIANATYLSANNTANLASATINYSNNFNSIANATTNLVTSFNNLSNTNFVQSNNLVASIYSIANTANSNNIDLLSILNLLVSNTEILSNNSSEFVDLAAGRTNSGVKILSPWEWLSMSSIAKFYAEQGVDLTALKNSVDSLPKSN